MRGLWDGIRVGLVLCGSLLLLWAVVLGTLRLVLA